MIAAMKQVEKIVNQPVTSHVLTSDMLVAMYNSGWFHQGANTPDYNNVDVRKTQDTSYAKNQ